ncbi:hypothetical protein BD414DRAFT_430463 [Trametes punicea]|nr:hypothetical protein BD414DRAFT_430463 [Trametes punicea]
MGKWTLEHHDEVLRNKMKNLVQGAVKRMNTERESPSISYEAFVEELDEGDSFTTSLIDVLVKEMAERRTRPNPIDRRLISERTAKALRLQAAPLHIYRGASSLRDRSRRGVPILPPRSYSTFRDLLSESEGEDEYGTILSTSGPLEGTRINTELYDAYFPSTDDLPGSLSRRTDPAPPPPLPTAPVDANGSSWVFSSPRSRSPPTARSIWPTSTGGPGSSLTRQPSIRRPQRSRTMDFNEFTSRRRSAMRNSNAQEDAPRADPAVNEASVRSNPLASTHTSESTYSDGGYTYYPVLPWSSARYRTAPSTSASPAGHARSRSAAAEEPASTASSTRSPSSSQLWYSLTTTTTPAEPESPSSSTLPSTLRENEAERPSVVAPRLRRGGLRPPESLLAPQNDASPSLAPSSGGEEAGTVPSSSSLQPTAAGPLPAGDSDAAGLTSAPTLAHSPEPPVLDSRSTVRF